MRARVDARLAARATFRWRLVRERVLLRRVAFYWHEHAYGRRRFERDRQRAVEAFEGDPVAKRAR